MSGLTKAASHSSGDMLVMADGSKWGPFTSHWAATAALIRLSDPTFESLGGDKAIDLAIEADIRAALEPNPVVRDCRPDGTGLDDGPYLPGRAPRKRPEPKPPEVIAEIRRRAWATRRAALSSLKDQRS